MAYQLGNVILPNPKRLTREFLETAAENILMEGRSTKRLENRKERFILEYEYLTASQVNNILSEYELNSVRAFTVTETNLSIGPTDVLIDIEDRNYPPVGSTYRENLTLILTEVL